MHQIQVKILSPGGIAEDVQVLTLRTSSALTPSTGQGPQKRAKPPVATSRKFPKNRTFPSGPRILGIQLVYLGWLGGKYTATLRAA